MYSIVSSHVKYSLSHQFNFLLRISILFHTQDFKISKSLKISKRLFKPESAYCFDKVEEELFYVN